MSSCVINRVGLKNSWCQCSQIFSESSSVLLHLMRVSTQVEERWWGRMFFPIWPEPGWRIKTAAAVMTRGHQVSLWVPVDQPGNRQEEGFRLFLFQAAVCLNLTLKTGQHHQSVRPCSSSSSCTVRCFQTNGVSAAAGGRAVKRRRSPADECVDYSGEAAVKHRASSVSLSFSFSLIWWSSGGERRGSRGWVCFSGFTPTPVLELFTGLDTFLSSFSCFSLKKTNGPQLSGGRGQRFNPGSTRLPPAHAPHQHQKTLPLLRLLGISQFNVNLSKMKCGAEVLVLTVRQNLKKNK